MALPEQIHRNNYHPSIERERSAALADIDRQLEFADEIENPIERFFRRNELLELKDELQAEIDMSVPLT